MFLFVGPYNKNEGGGVTRCPRVKEEVGPNTNKPISKTLETRRNIFICGSHGKKRRGVHAARGLRKRWVQYK